MDGYIKNKQTEIKRIRKTVLYKYSSSSVIVIFFLLFFLFLICDKGPHRWITTEIIYSHISEEYFGFSSNYRSFLKTKSYKEFLISERYVSPQQLRAMLVDGKHYSLVYSVNALGFEQLEAIYDNEHDYLSMDDAVRRWQNRHKSYVIALIITSFTEVAALVLIDRLWCENERRRINKLKADISKREERLLKRQSQKLNRK